MIKSIARKCVLGSLLLVLAGGCASSRSEPAVGAASVGALTPPKIVKAWFDPVEWDKEGGYYKTHLRVRWAVPKTAPARLDGVYSWRVGEVSGVGKITPQDVTKLAESFPGMKIPFSYAVGQRGEYTYTIRLRNAAGTDELTLPTLTVP